MQENQKLGLKALIAAGVVFGAVLAIVFFRHKRPPQVAHTPPMSLLSQPRSTTNQAGNAGNPRRPGAESVAFGQALRAISDAASARQQFDRLRQALVAAGPPAASRAIRKFLDSGRDVASHMEFKVGADGFLDQAPTLRTFLLDDWARLDPQAAAAYARTILEQMTAPDEWALALRNVALAEGTTKARDYLRSKTAEMLRNEVWQQQPSVGFLEAFDVAVYAGGGELVPVLSELVSKKDNPAVAHAAYLALDRLTIQDAATTLNALESQPELMAGRELTRANYFARADVRDTRQRQVLETYLLDPARSGAELERFVGLYPNANYMISQNLLTRSTTPTHAELTARDTAALHVLDEWLADERFARLKPHLQRARQRLAEFVQQAQPSR